MGALDIHIKKALEHGEEWVIFLAGYSDKRLDKKLTLARIQRVMAYQQKNEKAYEFLEIMEEIIIKAHVYKDEYNIKDRPINPDFDVSNIKTVVLLPPKKQKSGAKKSKRVIHSKEPEKSNDSQLSLF